MTLREQWENKAQQQGMQQGALDIVLQKSFVHF